MGNTTTVGISKEAHEALLKADRGRGSMADLASKLIQKGLKNEYRDVQYQIDELKERLTRLDNTNAFMHVDEKKHELNTVATVLEILNFLEGKYPGVRGEIGNKSAITGKELFDLYLKSGGSTIINSNWSDKE